MKNKDAFISELITVFPEIKEEVFDEDYLGSTSLQIGCFRRFTQRAIDRDDLTIVKKCFDFVDKNLEAVVFEVENSLVISYLGKLKIIKNSSVERLLSARSKDLRTTLESYYESQIKIEKPAKPTKNR